MMAKVDQRVPCPTLSREEAAEYLGIPRKTLENWASTRPWSFLPFTKVGRRVRYFRKDLDTFLERYYRERVEEDRAAA